MSKILLWRVLHLSTFGRCSSYQKAALIHCFQLNKFKGTSKPLTRLSAGNLQHINRVASTQKHGNSFRCLNVVSWKLLYRYTLLFRGLGCSVWEDNPFNLIASHGWSSIPRFWTKTTAFMTREYKCCIPSSIKHSTGHRHKYFSLTQELQATLWTDPWNKMRNHPQPNHGIRSQPDHRITEWSVLEGTLQII